MTVIVTQQHTNPGDMLMLLDYLPKARSEISQIMAQTAMIDLTEALAVPLAAAYAEIDRIMGELVKEKLQNTMLVEAHGQVMAELPQRT